MNSISLPEVNITLNSVANPSVGERRVLICGQTGVTIGESNVAGTATTGIPVSNVHLLPLASIQSLFGAHSILAHSIIKFLNASARQCALDVLPVAAPAGTPDAASATIAVSSGPATEAKTMRINVISKKDFTANVSVAVGDTASEVADAIQAAVDALTDGVYAPFTCAEEADTITITAADVGTIGNNFSISVENVPAGLTVAVTAFGSGSGAPTLTTIFGNLDDIRYTGILFPRDWEGSIEQAKTLLETRWNLVNVIQDGVAVVGYYDTASNINTKVSDMNTQVLLYLGNGVATDGNTLVKGGAITHYEDFLAAEFLAYRDTRLTEGANTAPMVATNSPLDQIGGMSLASLPYFNTPLPGVPQPSDLSGLFTSTDMSALADAGYTVVGKDIRNSGMLLGFTVTTYKYNTNGTEDTTFKYLNYVDTASMIREYIFNQFKADFAQKRLTSGSLPGGRSYTNAQIIRATVKTYFNELSQSELYGSLVMGGSEAEQFINKHLNVSVDFVNRAVTISAQVPIVGQLGTINFPITITTTLS